MDWNNYSCSLSFTGITTEGNRGIEGQKPETWTLRHSEEALGSEECDVSFQAAVSASSQLCRCQWAARTQNQDQRWMWHTTLWLDPKDTRHCFLEISRKQSQSICWLKETFAKGRLPHAANTKAWDCALLGASFHTKKHFSNITLFMTESDDGSGCFLHSSQRTAIKK